MIDLFLIYDPRQNAYLVIVEGAGFTFIPLKSDATRFKDTMAEAILKKPDFKHCLLEYAGTLQEVRR